MNTAYDYRALHEKDSREEQNRPDLHVVSYYTPELPFDSADSCASIHSISSAWAEARAAAAAKAARKDSIMAVAIYLGASCLLSVLAYVLTRFVL